MTEILASLSEDSVVISIGGIGSGIIALFWKIIWTRASRIEKQYEDHNKKIIEMSSEVGELQGRIGIAEELVPHLKHLKSSVEDLKIIIIDKCVNIPPN